MKKYILITAGILVSVLLCYFYSAIKKKYIENFLELYERSWVVGALYDTPYVDYSFNNNLELPETFEDIRKELKKDFDDNLDDVQYGYDDYINDYVRDFLSKEAPGFIHYIPLYNPDNLKRENFVLLSAGIDGKINNRYDWRDTLFLNDFQDKLKLYDRNKLISIFDDVTAEKKVYFNIFYYFFGKKDILIVSGDIIDTYKLQMRGFTYTLDKLIEEIDKRPCFRRIYRYMGVYPIDTLIGSERYIFFQHDDFLIRNKLYGGRDVILSDTMFFVGTPNGFDKENRIIDLRNCIQVDKEINRKFEYVDDD